MEPVRCHRCGDVIGVYEPIVVVDAAGARETAIAADREAAQSGAELYHRACYVSEPRPRSSTTRD